MSEVKNCEYYGYRVGDKFRIIDKEGVVSDIGNCNILTLSQDDGSDCPKFDGDNGNRGYASMCALEKIDEKTEWNGEGLPPVGTICELTNDADYFIEYMSYAIGNKVKVLSLFDMGGLSMAAVEYDGLCGCFRTDMLKPLRTKRDKWIERGKQFFYKDIESIEIILAEIYDAGLAKDIEE